MTRDPSDDALAMVPGGLWTRCAAAPHRLLLLDHDGTLAEFQQNRAEARPGPRALELLQRISRAGGNTLAIVSGRPLAELAGILGSLHIDLFAEHGWDVREASGRVLRRPLSGPAASVLQRAAALSREAGLGNLVETKRTALVLHTRGLAAAFATEAERACRAAWSGLLAGKDLRLESIDGGLELRATAWNKERAVCEALDRAPADAFAAYLGDDATDEDAFRAVAGRGIGIRVGPDERPSLAQGRLPSVGAVEVFLARWLEVRTDGAIAGGAA